MASKRSFTRTAWSSAAAQAVWEPRITAISRAWLDVELRSVADGFRQAALVFGSPAFEAERDRLRLQQIEVAPNRYAVAKSISEARQLAQAYSARDDKAVGVWLGFPECCISFFDALWNRDRKTDTTLSMAGDLNHAPISCNILGRWLGVRFVPHLPCSWSCQKSMALASWWWELWPQREAAWAREYLDWPVRYSSLHGIAIITNPIVKIVADTDYEPRERRLDRSGHLYPAEAPHGLGFPFQRPAFVPITQLQGFKDSVAAASRRDSWLENGFPTEASMEAAHAMVLHALATSAPQGMVLDLGCGNGQLLRRIREIFGVEVCGLEVDARKAAAERFIRCADLKDFAGQEWPPIDTAVISERRFEELPALRDQVYQLARQVIRYSYDEPQFATVESGSCVSEAGRR